MYTGTIFNWHDNSSFDVVEPVVDTTNRPLFMVVEAFDKGPEKLMEVDATNFNSLFGTMSYDKYGQASIQAQNIIDAGGRLLVKRVCANDSTLAYSVIVAHLKDNKISFSIEEVDITVGDPPTITHDVQKFSDIKAAAIEKWDKEEDGEITRPIFIIADNGRGISKKSYSIIPDYNTSKGVGQMLYKFNIYEGTNLIEYANISLDPSFTYNGNYFGLDKNRMTQITAEVVPEVYEEFINDICKIVFDSDSATYTASDAERKYVIYNVDFLNARNLRGAEEVYKMVYDPVTGKITKWVDSSGKGQIIYTYEKDSEGKRKGILLDVNYGNQFINRGKNGSYGLTPNRFGNNTSMITIQKPYKIDNNDVLLMQMTPEQIATSVSIDYPDTTDQDVIDKLIAERTSYIQYVRDIASVYLGYDTDGSPIDEIWDTDSHKIFAIADANYDKLIKDSIANFVKFREDCLFLRDGGIGAEDVTTVIDNYKIIITNRMATDSDFLSFNLNTDGVNNYVITDNEIRSRFIADYGTTYEVIDPQSRKNIPVTMIYDLVTALTTLYIGSGPFAPLAGTYNGFQLTGAIPGTINFTPIITPMVNQKEAIDDARINYAIFESEDTCVVQSNYTSQDMNSQLSYINNVLAIQEVARVVREACPQNRFRLITGSDMSEYAANINRVLDAFSTYFSVLEFQYTEDKYRSVQKIFYASINFAFNNWAQTEIFDLYALSDISQTSVYE